ncbi:hypothetical protein BC826DRAFT_1001246 [Russula brevipes]|nr:hypothetical protein BC826DRAFT_1001246 [Russula brevipes]
MTERTVRTSTHNYPYEEHHAMMDFYDGKTCVLTHNRLTVHWAHILDTALPTSNERVRHTFHLQRSSMLKLKCNQQASMDAREASASRQTSSPCC